MIVMRMTGSNRVCKIRGYDKSEDGWFPIDSVNFGFQEASAPTSSPTETNTNNNAQSSDPSDPDFTRLKITKQVDSTSGWLMHFAMQERLQSEKSADGEDVNDFDADIHFLEALHQDSELPVHSYLQIHLKCVLVKDWSISGSGDGRPVETVGLWFARAAMQYWYLKEVETANGKRVFQPSKAHGWDQTKNESWDPNSPQNKGKDGTKFFGKQQCEPNKVI